MRRLRSAGGGLVLALAVAQPGVGQTPLLLDTLHVAVDSRLASGAGAVQVLDAEELAALPVRSVEEALRWGLGIDLQRRSAAQADLSIRGSTFEQVLVLVDGVRMSDPQTGHFDLDLTVPLDRVERIEILRGPASAVHGADAVGGVVNVVTKDGRGLETT
ncbi:MAG TPA: TonB-dependent receptor plug domain-containing protein, partial [Longimicrobiales bacterium]|nr:TonB-dependent receptor plug domain-containing protein [Longimicrobiales bacterium]